MSDIVIEELNGPIIGARAEMDKENTPCAARHIDPGAAMAQFASATCMARAPLEKADVQLVAEAAPVDQLTVKNAQRPITTRKIDKDLIITKQSIMKETVRQGYYRTPHCNDLLYLHHKGYAAIEEGALHDYVNVRVLWLEGNTFDCDTLSDPSAFSSQLPIVRQLYLHANLFQGIPRGIAAFAALDTVNLGDNFISCLQYMAPPNDAIVAKYHLDDIWSRCTLLPKGGRRHPNDSGEALSKPVAATAPAAVPSEADEDSKASDRAEKAVGEPAAGAGDEQMTGAKDDEAKESESKGHIERAEEKDDDDDEEDDKDEDPRTIWSPFSQRPEEYDWVDEAEADWGREIEAILGPAPQTGDATGDEVEGQPAPNGDIGDEEVDVSLTEEQQALLDRFVFAGRNVLLPLSFSSSLRAHQRDTYDRLLRMIKAVDFAVSCRRLIAEPEQPEKPLPGYISAPLPRSHLSSTVTWLQFKNNHLKHVRGLLPLATFGRLAALDLQQNRIEAGDELLIVLSRCSTLRSLMLQGNPCVRTIPQYRRTVVALLPRLTYLDDRPVFPDERRLTTAWATGGRAAEDLERQAMRAEEDEKVRRRLEEFRRLMRRAQDDLGTGTDGTQGPSESGDSASSSEYSDDSEPELREKDKVRMQRIREHREAQEGDGQPGETTDERSHATTVANPTEFFQRNYAGVERNQTESHADPTALSNDRPGVVHWGDYVLKRRGEVNPAPSDPAKGQGGHSKDDDDDDIIVM